MKKTNKTNKKTIILDTAARLVLASGIDGLTFDQLARETEVSKGGLLYHFADKDALISGLIAAIIAGLNGEIARELASPSRGDARPGAWLRAFIAAAFRPDGENDRLFAVLIGGLPPQSPALEPLNTASDEWSASAQADGVPAGLGLTIKLAVEGAWLAAQSGAIKADDLAAVKATLLALTEHQP